MKTYGISYVVEPLIKIVVNDNGSGGNLGGGFTSLEGKIQSLIDYNKALQFEIVDSDSPGSAIGKLREKYQENHIKILNINTL